MNKSIILKSLYIALETGEVQIQRVERWEGLPEGAVIPDMYLPLERFTLLEATSAEKHSLAAALGDVTFAQAQRAAEVQVELLAEQAAHQTTQMALQAEQASHQATREAAAQAAAEAEQAMALLRAEFQEAQSEREG